MCNKWIQVLCSLWIISLFACEEVVTPELVSVSPVLVVDGTFNNFKTTLNQIKLSKTAPFNSPEPNPLIEGADISITIENNEYPYIEKEIGIYEPMALPTIQENTKVSLSIFAENKLYSAMATMPPKLFIDSATIVKRIEDLSFDDGYYFLVHFTEIENTTNFYMWEVYRNSQFVSQDEIILSDDTGINGMKVNFELPFSLSNDSLAIGDTITIYNYSLSKAAFDYFNGLLSLTVSGSPSQAIPDNPITNIRGGGLGFFNVCQIDSVKTIVVE